MHFEIVGENEQVETIAVGGRIPDIMRVQREFGPGRWRKLKGVARVRFPSGVVRRVELHWCEAHGIAPQQAQDQAYSGVTAVPNHDDEASNGPNSEPVPHPVARAWSMMSPDMRSNVLALIVAAVGEGDAQELCDKKWEELPIWVRSYILRLTDFSMRRRLG